MNLPVFPRCTVGRNEELLRLDSTHQHPAKQIQTLVLVALCVPPPLVADGFGAFCDKEEKASLGEGERERGFTPLVSFEW